MATIEDIETKLKDIDRLRREARKIVGAGSDKSHEKNPEEEEKYAKHRAIMRERMAEIVRKGQEIGDIPDVVNPVRKVRCANSIEDFARTYFPETFYLPFSPMHRRVIEKTEMVVRSGGLHAVAMPRASGKTALSRVTSLWAILYGYRSYVYFLGANAQAAKRSLEVIKGYLWQANGMLEDFPEAVYPLRKLNRQPLACRGQKYKGELTLSVWGKETLVFPTIPGSKSSGAVFNVAGLTSGFRGADFLSPSGKIIRPELVIPDDIQTDRAIDVKTPILTPIGFVAMGDLQCGDTVYDEHGSPCRVEAVSPVYFNHDCYKVSFDDGSSIVADAGHLWETSTILQRCNSRRKVAVPCASHACLPQCQPEPYSAIVTTRQIAETLFGETGQNNHSIPLAEAIDMPSADLLVPPYTLGYWLGDGDASTSRVTTADPETLEYIREDGFEISPPYRKENNAAAAYTVYGLSKKLRAIGVFKNKHLPPAYWFSSPEQRLAVLQGLMDTDGSASIGVRGVKGVRCTFVNTNRQLIDAVVYLCRSLGIKPTCTKINRDVPNYVPCWRVNFITSIPVFRMKRKLDRLPEKTKINTRRRFISNVEPVPSRPVRCIRVSSESHLFLCGHALIPTHNSAKSVSQCQERESILSGAVLGLAGPDMKIAGIMPCTVIKTGDAADRLLNVKLHPEWNGSRYALVESFPENTQRWDEYKEILVNYNPDTPEDNKRAEEQAQAYYFEHNEDMQKGAVLTWPERYSPDCLDALEYAMRLRIRDEAAFWAEYQNQPLQPAEVDEDELKPYEIMERVNRVPRRVVPLECSRLTAFIDVQATLLYYVVCGWADDFTGHVVDYGSFPDQQRAYFTLRDAQRTFADINGAAGLESQLFAGLKGLAENLLGSAWRREGGGEAKIGKCLIDAGFEGEVIKSFCRQSPFAAILQPSHGRGVGAGSHPINSRKKQPGDMVGLDWYIPAASKHAVRHIIIDTNSWKSFLHARLKVARGGRGALSLFGDNPGLHRMLADHLCVEKRTKMTNEKTGRTVYEWRAPPTADNHFFDALVGNCVAASILGASLQGVHTPAKPKKKKVSYSEMYSKAQGAS